MVALTNWSVLQAWGTPKHHTVSHLPDPINNTVQSNNKMAQSTNTFSFTHKRLMNLPLPCPQVMVVANQAQVVPPHIAWPIQHIDPVLASFSQDSPLQCMVDALHASLGIQYEEHASLALLLSAASVGNGVAPGDAPDAGKKARVSVQCMTNGDDIMIRDLRKQLL